MDEHERRKAKTAPRARKTGAKSRSPETPTPAAAPDGDGAAGAASRSTVPLLYEDGDLGARHASDRKFVWALARGLEILRAFRPGQGPLGNSELAEITGLPKATVSRLTYTLTELGYLTFIKRLGKYEPAPSILALGYPVLSNMRVRQIAHDYMQQLANHANASVALASRDRLSMIYVDECSSSALTTLRLDIGSRVPIATTALGRAFLAGLNEAERDVILFHLQRVHGADWPELDGRIKDAIAEVEDRGFCYVDHEWKRDVRGVGVPLLSADGSTVMAMNCAGPAFALEPARLQQDLGPRLVHLCRSIGPMIGR
ncbi:IclR family transcriptional regulator [Roseospira goensis]|uniref:DNA-binding IclR family transcriptional regulator n=1 Tax=Roseospira goensis TaxID=391922 RepID=A0A7W6RY24_9PROT|nr:IclR family transcriptional regulator [Roseospira goensis]MBB4285191.1 DNA-binding IclR family transcriptional regulator [Roseospira goensis]